MKKPLYRYQNPCSEIDSSQMHREYYKRKTGDLPMKKRILLILWVLTLLTFTACVQSNPRAESPGSETEKQNSQDNQKKNDMASENTSGKEDTFKTAEPDSQDTELWKSAYLEYLTDLEYSDSFTYSLIFVDEDEVPELVADSGFEAGGCQILTWHDGILDVLQTSRLYFTYIEKGNLLCNSEGNMGYYYDNVYTIKDDMWEFIGGGTYHDPPSGPESDENGNEVFEYEWLEQPVEQSEYEQKLHAIYPEKQGKMPETYYIKDEICSLLKTGKTTSANHRYELVVEDITWTEARRACEEKGGYLAALTSQEEFERIQEQILSEGKTSVTFFAGAANKENTFGFTWLEPGKEHGYNMLDLYNALFADYWLEGEPSYTGLTEDGQEVKEDCVSLIYRSSANRCYLNDVPDDILSAEPSLAGRVGYICEYDE